MPASEPLARHSQGLSLGKRLALPLSRQYRLYLLLRERLDIRVFKEGVRNVAANLAAARYTRVASYQTWPNGASFPAAAEAVPLHGLSSLASQESIA